MQVIFPPARGRRLMAGTALLALAACSQPLDVDMRDVGNVFDTTPAVQNLPARPRPDERGVITYPNYQVVVARRGDTVAGIAARLGTDPGELARYNGLEPDAPLRQDEIVALPTRVATAAPRSDVASSAAAAIDRAGGVTTSTLPPSGTSAAPAPTPTPAASAAPQAAPGGAEPIRHRVLRGETAFSIARRYGVPVAAIGQWNGLGEGYPIREGQILLVPQGGTVAPPETEETATAPGAGSPTPLPPSASEPLPEDEPTPAAAPAPEVETPDLGAEQSAPADDARFVRPAEGSIVRAYAAGRNEGIDIGAPAGTPVRAADAGTVAAVTTNTDGIQIVVIRHDNDLLTVYTHVTDLTVAKDDRVARGETIGEVRAGDPSFLHFEVREGMDSRDPSLYLP